MKRVVMLSVVILAVVLFWLPAAAHHRPGHTKGPTTTSATTTTSSTTTTTLATTTTTQPTTTTTSATTTTTQPQAGCDTAPDGAPAGSPVRGPATITTSQTISNVIYDGSHSDDLVRVYGVHVTFDHVTFRGTGTGSTGHTVEVKRGGSVTIRNSLFNGRPAEDTIQFGGPNGDQHANRSVVRCSTIASHPGEDHADFKVSQPGAQVDFIDNRFTTVAAGRTIQNDGSVGIQKFVRNAGLTDVLFEHTNNGTLSGSGITELYLYDAMNWLIQANNVGKLGHGVSSGARVPTGIYYRDNSVSNFEFYGGSCWATGNTPTLTECTAGAPSWYPR